MKIVVRGDTELGDSSTQEIEVKPKYFNPKYLEVYMGDKGEELLVKTYKVVEPLKDKHRPDYVWTSHFSRETYTTCGKCGVTRNTSKQPTQKIELLDPEFSMPYYSERMIVDKLNQVIEAVNKLQESNK